MAKKFLIILAAFLLTSCLKEDDVKIPFEGITPVELHDGWEIGVPSESGFDEAALTRVIEDFHNDKDLWQPRSLLVIKDGRLVAETYLKDPNDRTKPQAVWSCTKQVLAIIVMKALEEGYLSSLDVTVSELLPEMWEMYPEKSNITLRQLLTMTSGIGFENSGLNGDTNRLLRRDPKNSVEYILRLPMRSEPGKLFNYSDGDPQIISAMLSAVLNQNVYEWSKTKIFEPLEISDYDWLTYPDGITMGAFGLKLRPRDLAKFGQLILNNGVWNDQRIISEESVKAITTPLVSTNYEHQDFGLLWWINPEDGTPYMHGQGGQYVMLNRSKGIVVCITSEPNTQSTSQFSLSAAFTLYHSLLPTLLHTLQ